MGCDIHIITEKKNNDGKWEYVKEIPESLNTRNYATFAVLADVRNSFHISGFEPKGLPHDLGCRKCDFESESEHILNMYETGTERFVELPNGEKISPYDERLKKEVYSEEEANKYKGWSRYFKDGKDVYRVTDLSLVNGKYIDVPYKELMTFDEYKNKHWSDEWDDDANDYGWWRVDFDCPDYHSHSWLTLEELLAYDTSDYASSRAKVPKSFYDKFISLGGELPNGMRVLDDYEPSSIVESIQQAFSPEVIISWSDDCILENTALHCGIQELKEIANKYECKPNEIRIVFAFDN